MLPLTFLYDEDIDRPKLSEQKKTFEHIVPHQLKFSRGCFFNQSMSTGKISFCILAAFIKEFIVARFLQESFKNNFVYYVL